MAATARTLKFTAGTTTTIRTAFNVYGSTGQLMTITSSTSSPATITANIGTIVCDYVSVAWITATGSSGFVSPLSDSTDGGNNTGWIFMKDVQAVVVDTWKSVKAMQVKIAGQWKTVSKAQILISGVWKSVF